MHCFSPPMGKEHQGDCKKPFSNQVQEWVDPYMHFSDDDILRTDQS